MPVSALCQLVVSAPRIRDDLSARFDRALNEADQRFCRTVGPDFEPNTVFFVRFTTPQSAVGTYSYSVGSDIQDTLQNPVGITLVPA